jgi:hypothetical protein
MYCGPSSFDLLLLASVGAFCAMFDPVGWGGGLEEGELCAWRFGCGGFSVDGVDGELTAGLGDGDVGGV